MGRQADLSPNLGWPGGPCQVVHRIEENIRSPRMRGDMAEKVEHGDKLTNPEAAKIYTVLTERGGGLFRQIKITAHAQYRMDQRGITVGDLRATLANYSKQLQKWKSQKSWEWEHFVRDSMEHNTIEWVDKKLGDLEIVFVHERGTAVIVSTYWKGMRDPRPETCGAHPKHASYYRAKTTTIQEVAERWQQGGDKIYEDSMPLLVSLQEAWSHREFTWTREKSRGGFAKVEGKSVMLSGPLKWDALKADMAQRGWDPSDPAYVMIGQPGGI